MIQQPSTAADPVLTAMSGVSRADARYPAVLSFATQELTACHKLLDILDVESTSYGEKLTVSQRLYILVRRLNGPGARGEDSPH